MARARRIELLRLIAGNHTPCPCTAHQDALFFNRVVAPATATPFPCVPLRLQSRHLLDMRGGRPFATPTPFRRNPVVHKVDGVNRSLPVMLSHASARYSSSAGTHIGDPDKEYAFEMAGSAIRYGKGCTREIGSDVLDLNGAVVAVITDNNLKDMHPVQTVLQSLADHGVKGHLFSDVSVEPTLHSFTRASQWLVGLGPEVDVVIGVGGGSALDTAKAANLFASHPPPPERGLLYYANAPIGDGAPPPGPLMPLIAVPTTAGTGSETTGVAVFDYPEGNAKTGIAHRRLKPTLGIVDPENTASMPEMVAACSGFDVLCHALESYTALPFTDRPRPSRPLLRPAYQGSNPISDEWSLTALRMLSAGFEAAVLDRDTEAMANTLLAATYAGIGFGNAGVHLCHGMSYPVSNWTHVNVDFCPEGYESAGGSIIPHGMSVVTHAPAVFEWTASTNPKKHALVADIMAKPHGRSFDVKLAETDGEYAGHMLSNEIKRIMQKLKMPNGLAAIGVTEKDVGSLVHGTLPQKRVLNLAPAETGADELAMLFKNSMTLW